VARRTTRQREAGDFRRAEHYREMIALWRYRRFILETAVSDFRYRYAGSGLGVLWNVATPLAMLTLYTIIFMGVLAPRFGSGAISATAFPLYLASGFLPWAAFVECVTRGAGALVTNSAYLKKMPIPEQVFVAQTSVSAMLSMLIAVGLLIGLWMLLGQPPQLAWLALPLVVVLWQAFGFGLGLLFSTLNVFFRDVAQAVGVASQIWMWSVPIVYVEEMLPEGYRSWLRLNPVYPFVLSLRRAFLQGQLPEVELWAMMIAWVALAAIVGLLVLRSLRSELRDLV
jgi:lipopolysaccharide transport system permease protein